MWRCSNNSQQPKSKYHLALAHLPGGTGLHVCRTKPHCPGVRMLPPWTSRRSSLLEHHSVTSQPPTTPFTQETRKAWAGSFEEEPTKRKTRGHATTLPTTLPLTDHYSCHSNTSQPPNFSSPLETKSAWAETFEEERTKRKRSGHATTLPTTPI